MRSFRTQPASPSHPIPRVPLSLASQTRNNRGSTLALVAFFISAFLYLSHSPAHHHNQPPPSTSILPSGASAGTAHSDPDGTSSMQPPDADGDIDPDSFSRVPRPLLGGSPGSAVGPASEGLPKSMRNPGKDEVLPQEHAGPDREEEDAKEPGKVSSTSEVAEGLHEDAGGPDTLENAPGSLRSKESSKNPGQRADGIVGVSEGVRDADVDGSPETSEATAKEESQTGDESEGDSAGLHVASAAAAGFGQQEGEDENKLSAGSGKQPEGTHAEAADEEDIDGEEGKAITFPSKAPGKASGTSRASQQQTDLASGAVETKVKQPLPSNTEDEEQETNKGTPESQGTKGETDLPRKESTVGHVGMRKPVVAHGGESEGDTGAAVVRPATLQERLSQQDAKAGREESEEDELRETPGAKAAAAASLDDKEATASRTGEKASSDKAAGASGPGSTGAPRFAVLQGTYEKLLGRDVVWQIPDLPSDRPVKGTLLLAHGCRHQATHFWPQSQSCLPCIGLPEEMGLVREALTRGYATIAVGSAGGCWDLSLSEETSVDLNTVKSILKVWREKHELSDRPLMALGASSGGSFITVLARATKLASLAVLISPGVRKALVRDQEQDSVLPFPPTLFVHMPKDKGTAEKVELSVKWLREEGAEAAEVRCLERKIGDDYFSRTMGLDKQLSGDIALALVEAHLLSPSGLLRRGYRAKWKDALEAKGLLGRLEASNLEAVKEELNVAYAWHEISSERVHEIMDWFDGFCSVENGRIRGRCKSYNHYSQQP